jgi:hypothetical protein
MMLKSQTQQARTASAAQNTYTYLDKVSCLLMCTLLFLLQVSASRSSSARARVSMPLRTRTVVRAEESSNSAPPALDLSPNTQAVSFQHLVAVGLLQLQCPTRATCAQQAQLTQHAARAHKVSS